VDVRAGERAENPESRFEARSELFEDGAVELRASDIPEPSLAPRPPPCRSGALSAAPSIDTRVEQPSFSGWREGSGFGALALVRAALRGILPVSPSRGNIALVFPDDLRQEDSSRVQLEIAGQRAASEYVVMTCAQHSSTAT